MTKSAFDAAVDQLLTQFRGSLTSGRRTIKRNQLVGGVEGSPHTWGLGADVVWDDGEVARDSITAVAESLGLECIWEKDHMHIQPKNWVNRP